MMSRAKRAVLAVVLTAATAVAAEKPPYQRVLQGEDAGKAQALDKQIAELWATGKFAEALAPAERLRELRKRAQGDRHWQAADAARRVETLRQAAGLPMHKRAALVEAATASAKAAELYRRAKYGEAEPLFRKALAIHKDVLGPRHTATASSSSWLASNLDAQGRAQEAEPLHRQALAVSEEVLGAKHPDTAQGYNSLATNLEAQGRTREAETLLHHALTACEEVLGPKHPHTATTYHHLAANLCFQGRAKEGEPLARQALGVREEVLGRKHLDTAGSYMGLANCLEAQGRAREAEPLLRQALAVREEVLGPKHRETATSYNNLANNLRAQGRAKEAEPLLRQALAVWEEVLGAKHPYTATGYINLAANLNDQGRAQEAEPLFRKALAIFEEVLGAKHPSTATSYNNLAANLEAQGRAKEAEPLLRNALAVCEEVLRRKHPDIAAIYHHLAYNLDAQGRAKEAEPLHRLALGMREQVLGRKHPDTVASCHNLAANLEAQGRLKEAEPLFRQTLAMREEVLGPGHPDTALSCNGLAYNLEAQGRYKEAEPLYRRALAVFKEALGSKHPYIAMCCNNLANNLYAQGRHQEPESLLRQALAMRQEVLGRQHPHTAQSYSNLAHYLQTQGRAKEAEPLWLKGAEGVEAARLRLAASALDKPVTVGVQAHLGLAVCRARLGRPQEAWAAGEAGLARGLLDDLAARVAVPPDSKALLQDRQRAARLDALDRQLTPLLSREKLGEAEQRRCQDLLLERRTLDDEAARVAAERSAKAVLPLADVQAALAPDTALVFWLDLWGTGDHWGCVLRHCGPPAWARLKGSGPEGAWSAADNKLPLLLRDALDHGEPDALRRAARLAEQRLRPLEAYLAATDQLPVVRHLVVVPAGRMAGIPVEALSDRYLVSYAPSGTVLARLRNKHRPLGSPALLALGDPNFISPACGPPPQPPGYGLYLALVLPDGKAGRAGLRSGDVLLSYAATKLTTKADLKLVEAGEPVPVAAWRDGKVLDDLRVEPGKLGVILSDDPPAAALRKRRELDLLADARSRDEVRPLPGTRLEVAALAALLPKDKATVLLGSQASEQELGALADAGKLKSYRLVHLATHGSVDPVSAAHSALLLARDRLPGPDEQAKLAAAGKRVPTGRLTVGDIADRWDLDADLVVLSACQTGLGPDGGGEGLLGFAQMLLAKGARSLVLSLWKVDDTATALLMARFYQNLLGKRDGLKAPLPKAEALHEAKRWLRTLPRAEVEALAGQLARGSVRADDEEPGKPATPRQTTLPAGDTPFAHPRFWAAFILIGDPE
jgi:tetratricopeptide (TPR) repeat protein